MIRAYDFGRRWMTHKGLGIDEVIEDASKNEVDTISVISSGNYLRAILDATRGTEIKVVNIVNHPVGSDCKEVVIEGNRVLRDSTEREDFVMSQFPDAGKVKDYTDFIPNGLRQEARKIAGMKPDYIGLGVGSGKLFLSLAEAIEGTEKDTKLIGVVPRGENGIFNAENLFVAEDGLMYYRSYAPSSIADKLSTPYTFYRDRVLEFLSRGHQIIEVSNADLRKANKKANSKWHFAEPSGSAGFVLYDEKIRKACGIEKEDDVLVLNTGNGRGTKNVNFLRLQNFGRKIMATLLPFSLMAGAYKGFTVCEKYCFERAIAEDVAKMSREELWKYVDSERVQEKIGGPPWFR